MNKFTIYGIISSSLIMFSMPTNAQETSKPAPLDSNTHCDDTEKLWAGGSCKTTNTMIGVSQALCHLHRLTLENSLLKKVVKGQMSDEDLNEFRLETNLITANLMNRGGDALVANKCPAEARKLFMSVIDTYTGTAYEAARQHAMIGIEDARALSTK